MLRVVFILTAMFVSSVAFAQSPTTLPDVEASIPATQPTTSPDDASLESDDFVDDGICPTILPVIALILCLVLIGVGIVVGLTALAILFLLIALGVVSASVVIGFHERRVTTGFRAFFLQHGAIAGALAGAAGGLVVSAFAEGRVGLWALLGAIVGILAGFTVAWLFNQAWLYAIERLRQWWEKRQSMPVKRG
jgi:MFS family permease